MYRDLAQRRRMLALVIALSLHATEALTPPPFPSAEVELVQTPQQILKRGYRPRLGLLIPGASVFAVSYIAMAVPALLSAGVVGLFGGDVGPFAVGLIPVAGPILFGNSGTLLWIGVVDAVAQFSGLSLMVLSFVFPERPTKWVNATKSASVELTGTGVRGTF